MFMGYGMGFDFYKTMFVVVFALIAIAFVLVAARSIAQWNKNNHSPRLTVNATVVAKRADVSHHRHQRSTSSSTWYYVTFQVESGDRMEFSVTGSEYGQLAEGDRGSLTFQGTRYLSFKRDMTA